LIPCGGKKGRCYPIGAGRMEKTKRVVLLVAEERENGRSPTRERGGGEKTTREWRRQGPKELQEKKTEASFSYYVEGGKKRGPGLEALKI